MGITPYWWHYLDAAYTAPPKFVWIAVFILDGFRLTYKMAVRGDMHGAPPARLRLVVWPGMSAQVCAKKEAPANITTCEVDFKLRDFDFRAEEAVYEGSLLDRVKNLEDNLKERTRVLKVRDGENKALQSALSRKKRALRQMERTLLARAKKIEEQEGKLKRAAVMIKSVCKSYDDASARANQAETKLTNFAVEAGAAAEKALGRD